MKPEPFQPGLARVCAEMVQAAISGRQAGSSKLALSQRRRPGFALVWFGVGLERLGGEKIGIDKIVALYGLAGKYG